MQKMFSIQESRGMFTVLAVLLAINICNIMCVHLNVYCKFDIQYVILQGWLKGGGIPKTPPPRIENSRKTPPPRKILKYPPPPSKIRREAPAPNWI